MDPHYIAGGGRGGGSGGPGGGGRGRGGRSSHWLDELTWPQLRLPSPSPSPNAFFMPPPSPWGYHNIDGSVLRFPRPYFPVSPSPPPAPVLPASVLRHDMEQRGLVGVPHPRPPPAAGDEVLVMDGVLLSGPGASRPRSASAGIAQSPSAADLCSRLPVKNPVFYRDELCRTYGGGGGGCRFGSKCKFAHGMEELLAMRELKTKALEVHKAPSSPCPSPAKAAPSAAVASGATNSIKPATTMTTDPDSSTLKPDIAQPPAREKFTWPPTKEEDAYMTQVLYGPSSRSRLPVFKDICPE